MERKRGRRGWDLRNPRQRGSRPSNYKLPNAEISAGLSALLEQEGVDMVQKERCLHALELFASAIRHFGDACACAVALEATEVRLFSFDGKFASVPGIVRPQRYLDSSSSDLTCHVPPNPGSWCPPIPEEVQTK